MKRNVEPDIERDSFRHADLQPLPATDDDSFSVHEVNMSGRSLVREVLETVGLTLLIFLLVRLIVQNFMVEGVSMTPTLRDQQGLLVNKVAYARWDSNFFARLNPFGEGDSLPSSPTYLLGPPARGDIVVFRPPNDSRDFIKRVIGLPGDTVEVRAYQGVFVNGRKLPEPYIADTANYDWPAASSSSTIPPDHLFVLGDNRRNSDDSHVFGPIALDSVAGRAWFSYWPRETIGSLPHPTYPAP